MAKVTYPDKERFEKFMRMLTEQEFNVYLDELKEAVMGLHSSVSVTLVINASKDVLSQFSNEILNEKYLLFIESLDHMRIFVWENFSFVDETNGYELLSGRRNLEGEAQLKVWDEKYIELCAWIANTKGKYDDLLKTVRTIYPLERQQQETPKNQAADSLVGNKKFTDDLEIMKAEIQGLKAVEASRQSGALSDIMVGPLSYKGGSVYFDGQLVEMRSQLNMLCHLFICNHEKVVEYYSITEQIVTADKRKSMKKKNISKYVSELHILLKKRFRRKVIFNHKKEGYILDTNKDS